MRIDRRALLSSMAAGLPAAIAAAQAPRDGRPLEHAWIDGRSFLVICWHNLEDSDPDQTYLGVTSRRLVEQLTWLQANGYTAVTIDEILAARDGRRPLPPKAVLLSFDDGYRSFYTQAFPVLRAMNLPAVVAVVTGWLRPPAGSTVVFGDVPTSRGQFMSWEELREIAASGLVEIAAHTDDHHQGRRANPQGNLQPAVATRVWREGRGYESEKEYSDRLRRDFRAISDTLHKTIGRRPRVMVWPYGAYTGTAQRVAREVGMPIAMSLEEGFGSVAALDRVPRLLISYDPPLDEFARTVHGARRQAPLRVVHADLDYVYDPDPAQQDRNLGALVQRVHDLGINTVFLQAFADPSGGGLARQLYFPNRHLPMRADLFNRAVWQLVTRARVRVYAWMPVLAYELPGSAARVLRASPATGAIERDPDAYARISPFDPQARRIIREIHEDLARAAPIAGLLFHDDAVLSDFEDASPPALAAYRAAGLPDSIAALRTDPAVMARWTRFKTGALSDFTRELIEAVRRERPGLRSARNLFAMPLLDPRSEAWFAQNYDQALATYDHVAVMAMPMMENVPEGEVDRWLARLVSEAARRPEGLARTLFELQAVDWRKPVDDPARRIPDQVLLRKMRTLVRGGALSFGYYPDDFAKGHPDVASIGTVMSLRWFPHRR
ncbi:MAG: poly-beta-1,6-N-acetyl-D-glucosamine N-deacetylase PgaB [Alphaproteobacteria bacterium]|nr:poly-beta-1,6-N-acetyl-D-glucosamine N-deacetylase PgaB [Alphaproteobacteria bacterium]